MTTTWYLKADTRSEFRNRPCPEGFSVTEAEMHPGAVHRLMYEWVGRPWQWINRLSWTEQQWQDYAADPELRLWIASYRGCPAGFFELHNPDLEGRIEIAYFGLAEEFLGQKLGGFMIDECLRAACSWAGAREVWVHTCSLDHPSALANYQSGGMEIYRTEKS